MQITYEQIRKAVMDEKNAKVPIMRRWDYYRNDVARPPYFPLLLNESQEHYRDRLKIPVGWCGTMANRIATYFRKGPIDVSFSVDGKEDDSLAKEASELWSEIASYNNWEPFMVDVARDAGVGGNAYTKSHTALFDVETGAEIKTGAYKGRVFIDRVNEVFVFRVDFNGTPLYVEAWERIAGGQPQLLSDSPETDKYERIEVILPASFNPITGEKKTVATWVIWEKRPREDRKLIYGPEAIPFELPIRRFANLVSRPASEDGMSDIEWSIPLVNMVNHVFSGAARAVQYHGEPKIKATGIDDLTDIKWGTDNVLGVPEGADLDFLTWDQNIGGAKSLYSDAIDLIGSISTMPKHMMRDLDNAGAVASGVALRIMYEGMNQVCTLKEAGFKEAEEKTIHGTLSQLAFYNGKAGHFDAVQVSVKYNPDRTPRDSDAEFDGDLKKLVNKYFNLVDIVMKHEPSVKTREEAIEYLKTRAEENKLLRDLGVIQAPPTGEWADEEGGDEEGKSPEDENPEDENADEEKPVEAKGKAKKPGDKKK